MKDIGYPIRIGDEEIVLDVPSPLVVAMLDSLQAPATDPRSLRGRGLRLATGAKTLLTVGVTATPEFAIKNAMRDMLCAFALGRIWQGPWHMLGGAADEVRQSAIARDWLLQGGTFASFYEHSTEHHEGNVESIVPGASRKGQRLLRRVWQGYTAPMRALEAGSRLSQYRRVLARGGTPREAMMHARQVSTDFADRGASEAWWTYCRTVAFLNAALQGMNQLRKVFFTRSGLGGKTRGPFDVMRHSGHARRSYLPRALLLVAIPAGALWWNASSEERLERYESQAAFEKASHVYLYNVAGTDYRIPVPFELGAVFMKFPELVLDRVLGLKTVDTDRAVDPLPLPTVRSLAESTFLLSFIPALVQPTWYVLRNEDFLGREIEPRYMRDWRSADRFFASTPALARAIGTAIPGVSPLQAKVLLEGHLGHMARLAIHGTEEALWDTGKNGEMALPQFWYRASGRRAIIREGPRRYTRHTLDLKLLDARAGAASWRCDRDWRTCEANADWLAVADYVSDYTSFRREMNDFVRELETARGETREKKEAQIVAAFEARARMAREVNQAIAGMRDERAAGSP